MNSWQAHKKGSRITVFCHKPQLTYLSQIVIHVLSPRFVFLLPFLALTRHNSSSQHHSLPHPLPESCQQSLHLLPFLWNIYDSWCLNQELASVFPVLMGKTKPVTLFTGLSHVNAHTRIHLFSHTHTASHTHTHTYTQHHTYIKWK